MGKHALIEELIYSLNCDVEHCGLDASFKSDVDYVRGLIDGLNLAGVITDEEKNNYKNTLKLILKKDSIN